MPTELPRDRACLVAAVERGESFDFLFFWGHRPPPAGQVDASCLSQWFPARFEIEGVEYATAEHFMMAGKARARSSSKRARSIRSGASASDEITPTPASPSDGGERTCSASR
jgi:predicted NAD-dependent protein-ADP-ribosyltransferase YbiA (DUF1768 family)